MRTVVTFDPEKCSGCWACTMACADQNDLRLGEGDAPYRLVRQIQTGKEGLACVAYQMEGCLHCGEAACMKVCPRQCFTRLANGLVQMDLRNCVGCGQCRRACPQSAIVLNREGTLVKCDGCADRAAAGFRPACEQICPSGALVFFLEQSGITTTK